MITPPPVSSLESHVGYWLRYVSNHVSHAFKLKIESRGVTVAEWVVLRVLFDLPETKPSDLAKRVGLTRGAVSKLVERLVSKELVKCVVLEEDRRYQKLSLTAAGRKLVPALARLADRNDAEFFGQLTDRQRTELLDMLRDIVRHRELTSLPVD